MQEAYKKRLAENLLQGETKESKILAFQSKARRLRQQRCPPIDQPAENCWRRGLSLSLSLPPLTNRPPNAGASATRGP